MKMMFAIAALAMAAPVAAQQAQPGEPVTIESYYRIKWGSAEEFKRLYKANHQPLIDEMKRQGLIVSARMDEPFTHMAGNQRWDLRVTFTYRDPAAAVVAGGAFDKAWAAAKDRLYPDRARLDTEEARRFSLLEEHWDVIVTPAAD